MSRHPPIPVNDDLRQKVKMWREEYRNARYLQKLPLAYVLDRRSWVLRNVYRLGEYRRMSNEPLHGPEKAIWQMLVEVSEEFRLRDASPRYQKDKLRDLKTGGAPIEFLRVAENAIQMTGYPTGHFLVRYGKRRYLKTALSTGSMRISPASSFNEIALVEAIKDNELLREVAKFPVEVSLTHALSRHTTQVWEMGSLSFPIETDYYILSMSTALTPTLFWEFCKDDEPACLIITDVSRFFADLRKAFFETVGSWACTEREMRYVDPAPWDNAPQRMPDNDLFFLKDFRYFFEAEVRMVWRPPKPMEQLDHVTVSIPQLDEYADLVTFL